MPAAFDWQEVVDLSRQLAGFGSVVRISGLFEGGRPALSLPTRAIYPKLRAPTQFQHLAMNTVRSFWSDR